MEHRRLGNSGLKVPVLCYGTGTFGGRGDFWKGFGETDLEEAKRLVDLCLDAGVSFFDTADIYSRGQSEEILGAALAGRRDQVILSTKVSFRMGDGPNDLGSSRHHIVRACEASLRRLRTDYIDLYHLHGFDAQTPVEETLAALDDLVRAGKVRYLGASNFSGWHLMKSLAVSDRRGWSRYASHQVYYSLVGRELEWELMPLHLDQGVGSMVWSPLGWGRLTGKIRRGQPIPEGSRMSSAAADAAPPVPEEKLFQIVDALEAIAAETGKNVPQIALAWLLTRPSVSSIVIGARNELQLRDNLACVSFTLTADQVKRLDAASVSTPIYPYWHQSGFRERNPSPVE